MKITKFGQCCLLIETVNKRILTDPGRFSVSQNEVSDIDLILITHEHADHLHVESLQAIIKNNPQATVITNEGVGKMLSDLAIPYQVLKEAQETLVYGVSIEAFEGKHVEIFEDFGQVQNTGFFIDKSLFYPGDAYINPQKPVEVLALPVSGPWCKASDAITYACTLNPKKAFPVHDAVLNADGTALVYGLFELQLQAKGIEFVRMTNGDTQSF